MNWNRADLKEKGKYAFKKNYWKCVLVSFILAIVTNSNRNGSSNSARNGASQNGGATDLSDLWDQLTSNRLLIAGVGIAVTTIVLVALIALVIGIAVDIFAFNPLEVGCQRFFLENAYSDQARPNLMGSAFRDGNYRNIVTTMFQRDLYTFLWGLLLIIPGIVKAYEYRMIPYLLAENPYMTSEEAFRLSKEMMDGEKMNAFILDLSFIGWHLLSAFTLGILGVFYVAPYQNATNAELYFALKRY